jgi:hypothetical protein
MILFKLFQESGVVMGERRKGREFKYDIFDTLYEPL